MRTKVITLVVRVDEDGDYSVEAADGETLGGVDETQATRRLVVNLTVPIPSSVVLTADIPAEGAAELRVG